MNETDFNKTAIMVLAREKRLFADMKDTDFDEMNGLTNLSFDDPNWAYNYFNLAVLSVATVLYGTGIALTLWVVSHVRICRECLIIALAINQIVSISIKGVVRPWTDALTWLLLFFNIFWLPFLIMAIRFGYLHVMSGGDKWLLTLEKFQTTDLILGPSVVGLIVFVVLYVTASEQVKKGRLSQSATNTTKISLAFLSILLIRCGI